MEVDPVIARLVCSGPLSLAVPSSAFPALGFCPVTLFGGPPTKLILASDLYAHLPVRSPPSRHTSPPGGSSSCLNPMHSASFSLSAWFLLLLPEHFLVPDTYLLVIILYLFAGFVEGPDFVSLVHSFIPGTQNQYLECSICSHVCWMMNGHEYKCFLCEIRPLWGKGLDLLLFVFRYLVWILTLVLSCPSSPLEHQSSVFISYCLPDCSARGFL